MIFPLNKIRATFLDFFKNNGHTIVPSSPLIPHNDPSLMFTNSGMVQFKNIFTGEEAAPYQKAATAQKCVRAGGKHNDLDNVGYTARHHTFFEMLGNFSFGDYFKEQAIFYAWECLTKYFALPKDKLYVTVYHTDNEAINYWKKIASLGDDRIIKIATNDNFWSMGDVGPCGPCTEIFYDHGEKIFGGLPGTPDEDGDRYVEIWNLVFMQFEQSQDGARVNLPKPCIDTGMGLERIATVLQGVHNNFEIDLFKNIINYIESIIKVKAAGDNLVSYRVIADHLRSSSFLIADGVMPSNEGRGYVLRRIMRRAMRHVHQLKYNDPLMYQLVPALINEMGEAYPELKRAQHFIEDILLQEELKFKNTLDKGIKLLSEEISRIPSHNQNSKVLPGDVVFKLYDTYGFPLDLTTDILRQSNITVDQEGFNACMNKQKAMARAAWKGSGEIADEEKWFELHEKYGATEFLGYEHLQAQAKVLEVLEYKDQQVLVITNQTPFYGESGGQLGDVGIIKDERGNVHKIIGTLKFLGKIHAHICDSSDRVNIGSIVTLTVDNNYRKKLRANHSATHLLHYVLRKQLGNHVTQKGSLVASDKLRFDFNYSRALSAEEIMNIEKEVNQLIRNNLRASVKIMELKEAINSGVMALFGEKYEEQVRVVAMGDSIELCGGTHVAATGEIGLFKIVSESAIAAGIRRIEAITGEEAINHLHNYYQILADISGILKAPVDSLALKTQSLLSDKKKLERDISTLKLKALSRANDTNDADTIEKLGSYNLIVKIVTEFSPKELRSLVDSTRNSMANSVVIAVSNFENKSSLIIGINPNITELDAAEIVKSLAQATGGNGGGRNDIAQFGGFNFGDAEDIVSKVKEIISNYSFSI